MNATRIIAAALCGLLCLASAQGALKPAVKGAKPGEWTYDFDAAKVVAAEKNIPIFLYFNGKCSCGIVMGKMAAVERQIFNQPAWGRFAKNNFMLVSVDIPYKGQASPGVPPQFWDMHEKLAKFNKYRDAYWGYGLVAPDGETKIAAWSGKPDICTPEYFGELVKAQVLMSGAKKSATAPPAADAAKPAPAASAGANAVKPATEGAAPGEWTMDFEAAKEFAAANNAPILLFFTGSDWSRTAQGAVRSILGRPAFLKFAKEGKLTLVWVDLPEDASLVPEKFTAQNAALRKEYLSECVFPACVLLASDGVKKIRAFDNLPNLAQKDLQDGVKFHLPK